MLLGRSLPAFYNIAYYGEFEKTHQKDNQRSIHLEWGGRVNRGVNQRTKTLTCQYFTLKAIKKSYLFYVFLYSVGYGFFTGMYLKIMFKGLLYV